MSIKKKNEQEPIENSAVLSSSYKYSSPPLEAERLREILENIPSAVMVLEKPDGMVTFVNKKAIDLFGSNPFGLKLEEHATASKIYLSDGKVCPTEQLYTYRALYNGETILNAPEIIEQPDGKRRILNVSAKPLYDKEGKSKAAVTIFDDVTERVKTQEALQESEERLKMAQRIAHIGSWEYDVKLDRAIWSEELFRIFGMKPQKYGPNTTEYIAFIHPEDREKINEKMDQLLFHARPESKASFDYRAVRRDGSVRTIHSERVVREMSDDSKPARIVGIEQDITERKQIEQKLEEYAKNLEQIVDERTRQLQNAERLAAIGQTAAMIGHDIRNPLQSITGELFLMKQDTDSWPDSESKIDIQESLRNIQEQADYIDKIISDLQDFARPLKPEIVEVDLHAAIPPLLSTVIVPNNIKLIQEYEQKLQVKTDYTFLKRILVNLVTNAIQAMPDGGNLTIKAFHDNSSLNVTVSDTGVGIPDEVKSKLFQPLMTTKSKGQGFGLAVVKRLMEAQGGKVSFESKLGEGTQFKIIFPNEKK
jgi:PAS domain S-box-containing protein